ncbi:type IV secretion system protein TraC [Thiohalocapsa sp.]|uniref:type IV secretion system protein TraC n=1 Tax=Thiohalocapsa sp. TaxID=2497641 RepID=UPI0025F2490F|nr:type IV secretion system protein TraC [Thiohalocapsa sp.]
MSHFRQINGERAAALFPVLAFDPETHLFLLDDQTLGAGFLCQPLSFVDQGLFDRLLNLINLEWPQGTLMQIALWTSPDIIEQMTDMENLRLGSYDPLLRSATQRTADFLRAATTDPLPGCADTRVRDVQVLVCVKFPLAGHQPTEHEHRDAVELATTALQVLSTAGLRPERMSADRYVRIVQALLNWSPRAGWRDRIVPECAPDLPICSQLLDYDAVIRVDADGLMVGDQRIQTLSMKRFPDRATFGLAMRYLGDPFSGTRGVPHNILITLNLLFPDPEVVRMRLNSRSQWAAHQTTGQLAHYMPGLVQRKQEYDTMESQFDAGDRPVEAYLGMALFTSEEEASKAASNVRTYWRELGFQVLPDSCFSLPLLLHCLPFGADRKAIQALQRYRTLSASHVAILAPVFGDWKGNGSPVVQLLGRQGQLMSFDLYAPGSTNYNAVVAAASGAGKSFFANELIATNLSVGGRAWVIDVGRSYEKLCDSLEGQFIQFSADSQVVINPFELIEDWAQESDQVAGLVEAMAAPSTPLEDYHRAGLKRVLSRLWKQTGAELDIDQVAQVLLEEKDQRLRDVGEQLFPFTTEGEYGRFFAGHNTIRFDSDLVVLELEELKGRKHLQQVVLLCLIYQIQQSMYLGHQHGESRRRKLLMIDEAWDLLTAGAVGHFVMEGYRRFRTYFRAAVTITPSLSDLYENPNGRAIASNCCHSLLLRQPSQIIDQLHAEKRLPLADGGVELLKTVHTYPGAYSEIMLLSDGGGGIGRLVVDDFRKLLYSTQAGEVAAIRERREAGLSVEEAINDILGSPST